MFADYCLNTQPFICRRTPEKRRQSNLMTDHPAYTQYPPTHLLSLISVLQKQGVLIERHTKPFNNNSKDTL